MIKFKIIKFRIHHPVDELGIFSFVCLHQLNQWKMFAVLSLLMFIKAVGKFTYLNSRNKIHGYYLNKSTLYSPRVKLLFFPTKKKKRDL